MLGVWRVERVEQVGYRERASSTTVASVRVVLTGLRWSLYMSG